jgi:hypothetical protein
MIQPIFSDRESFNRRTLRTGILPQPVDAWVGIFSFSVISLLLLILSLGKILNFAFPALALALGIYLFSRHRILYSGFVWWLWFLTPLVRRISDYRSSFTDPSPILLAPYLVTLITLITLAKHAPSYKRPGSMILGMAFFGILYGYIIGVFHGSASASLIKCLEWLAPLAFSYHLFVSWKDYPAYAENMKRVFLWGMLVSSGYGIYQYLVAPEWDCSWLVNTALTSMGRPEPREIRVWGTMHGSGVFAVTTMAGLILLIETKSSIYWPATVASYLSFLLSMVRSAWAGWMVAIISLLVSVKPQAKMRLVCIAISLTLLLIPLTSMPEFSSVINDRVSTLSDLESDASASARKDTYQNSVNEIIYNPIGQGITNAASIDSAFLTIGTSLGWIGGLSYLGSLLLLVAQIGTNKRRASDSFTKAAESIVLGLFFQLAFGPTCLGLPGMILWSFLGMLTASRLYYSNLRHSNQIDILPYK